MSLSRDDENELQESLSSSFQKMLDINDELNNSSLPTNDKKFQAKVHEAINRLKQMTNQVNQLGLFSSNETIKEMSTGHLKYLLLPALLADFTLKNLKPERLQVLEEAEIYYKDYISRLNDYQLCDIELSSNNKDNDSSNQIKTSSSSSVDSLIKAAQQRNSKINRYRQMKDLEQELQKLRQLILAQQSSSGHSIDEDLERKFYMKLIRRWLNQALDELNTIDTEMQMVKMRTAMFKMNSSDSSASAVAPSKPKSSSSKSSFQPMIITKDRIQKQVYGAGYPSLPTYSVDEFISQKMDEGSLKLTDKNIYSNSLLDWSMNPAKKKQEEEDEEERKEHLIEQDDQQELDRLRRMDEWKDVHRRGEGNRHNMG